MPGTVHFWCPAALALAARGWDPDAEPQRFASGVGHAVLELAVRLRSNGFGVTLGEQPAAAPQLVVAAAGALRKDPRQLEGALRLTAAAGGRIVLIRSDTPLGWHLPLRPTREVVPRRGLVAAAHQTWVPQLPQRGLVPRRPGPLDRISTVTLKCNPVTLPEALRDGLLAEALERRGVRLWIDMPERTDGSDQTWHDFGAADAVLCARAADEPDWIAAKPPTKLVNAWVAGCIPLATREAAYVELAHEDDDVVFLDDVAELPAAVERLNAEPQLLARLERGVATRRAEFDPDRVLSAWRTLLEGALAEPPSSLRAARASLLAEQVRLRRWRSRWRLAFEERLRRVRHSRA